MAQDKIAEIIKFNGAGEAPQSPVPPEAAPDPEAVAQSLEEVGAGAFLAQARHMAGLTIEEASEATKVKADHLEAIEWMRLDRLPPLPYAIGFVKAYARYLGLDAETVAAQFKTQIGALAPLAPEAANADPVAETPSSEEGGRLVSVFAMLAVAMFVLWVGFQVLTGGGEAEVKTPPAVAEQAPAAATLAIDAPLAQAADDATLTDPAAAADIAPPVSEAIAAPGLSEAAVSETGAPSDRNAETSVANAPATDPVADAAGAALEPSATPLETTAETNAPAEDSPVEMSPAEPAPPARPLPRRPQPAPQPVIVEANLTRSVAPAYPDRCTRGASDLESVTIMFDVSAAGRAVNARVQSSSNACFESEALRTLDRWRFDPRTLDGRAVSEAGKRATLNFRK
jgi:cytoskeleton protein RodZ